MCIEAFNLILLQQFQIFVVSFYLATVLYSTAGIVTPWHTAVRVILKDQARSTSHPAEIHLIGSSLCTHSMLQKGQKNLR